MKTSLALLCALFFYSFSFAQSRDLPPNAQPGKCYARCMIPPTFVERVDEYAVYTGSTPEKVKLKTVKIIKEPATTKWVKKGEGDRKAWCLVETPAVTEKLTVLKNTKHTDEYEIVRYSYTEQIGADRKTEWREVLCNEKITENIILQLQEKLQLDGYYKGTLGGILDVETKTALTAFQKENALPIGNLDMETLASLGL